MDQQWFEMALYRQRSMSTAVWIPLHAVESIEKQGRYGYVGYKEDFFGCGSVAFLVEKKALVETLGWNDIGIGHNHGGNYYNGIYTPAEIFQSGRQDGLEGINFVLIQRNEGSLNGEWYINTDLILALGLYRENDKWVKPDEGYVEVIRLDRNAEGRPAKIEIKAEYLKDYLCARGLGLYVTWYRDRDEILEDATHIQWAEDGAEQNQNNLRWEGRVMPIHEGGQPFGSSAAVFHVTRTDVDFEEDVPSISFPPNDSGIESKNWTRQFTGKKLFRVMGEIWREEWIAPSAISPRIKGDKTLPAVSFIVDAAGKRENSGTLADTGKWLWFKPDVINTLLKCRDGALEWHTKDTGEAGGDASGTVTFGLNEIGLVNVYAKDIALLPEWQQQIWAGFNIGPDGGVSKELLQSQAVGKPSNTQAPEAFIAQALITLNDAIKENFGVTAFRSHEDIEKLVSQCHRFRALTSDGLLALAKDLARLTADSINAVELQKVVPPPNKEKWGSLKSLEKLVASKIGDEQARKFAGPLFGIYDLRLADAHLSSNDLSDALKLVGVDEKALGITQGHQMLRHFVSCLFAMADAVDKH
jgi:hypothetical protein